jgi:hypothetical protein
MGARMKEFLIGVSLGVFIIILIFVMLLTGCATAPLDDSDDSDAKPLKIELTDNGDVLIPAKIFERMQAIFLYEKTQVEIGASWKLKYENALICVADNERQHFSTKECFEEDL